MISMYADDDGVFLTVFGECFTLNIRALSAKVNLLNVCCVHKVQHVPNYLGLKGDSKAFKRFLRDFSATAEFQM